MRCMFFSRQAINRGLSIIELIVVMAILSIIMMAIMSFVIPTQQSMKKQSQVTEVQSNLNLAMNVLTRDLLTAGFLVDPAFDPPVSDANCPAWWKGDSPGDNMAPGAIFWQGNDITEDNDDLTIRTRAFGDAFAVVDSVSVNTDIAPTNPEMFANFCDGDAVKINNARVFNPVGMKEVGCTDYSCEMIPNTANVVSSCVSAGKTFRLNLAAADVPTGSVIIGSRGGSAMSMQAIRYRVNNGTLERIVNGTTQNLARGVTSINFAYGKTSSGTVNRVDVTLTGVITAMKAGDAQLGEKTRVLTTSVALRNVF